MVLSVTALAFQETYVDTGEILSIFGKNREVDFNANEGALECSLQDSFFLRGGVGAEGSGDRKE